MEQNRPEEKVIIEESLSRGQKVSFPVEQAPAKIELSLGGVRDKHPEGTGAKPAKLSIYKVSELPKVNDQYVYDGYIINPNMCLYCCIRRVSQFKRSGEHHRYQGRQVR